MFGAKILYEKRVCKTLMKLTPDNNMWLYRPFLFAAPFFSSKYIGITGLIRIKIKKLKQLVEPQTPARGTPVGNHYSCWIRLKHWL